MENCRFLNEDNVCKALNVEKAKCALCNFYQTQQEWNYKEEKVRKWYRRRGINYDTYLLELNKGE